MRGPHSGEGGLPQGRLCAPAEAKPKDPVTVGLGVLALGGAANEAVRVAKTWGLAASDRRRNRGL